MQNKNLILFFTFFSFLVLASTGLLMFITYQDSSYIEVLGMKKNSWLNIHMVAAAITAVFIFYHVAMRWTWIENIILRKDKAKPDKVTIGRRRNITWLLLFFSLSFSTGFLNFLLEGECLLCEEYHDKIGLVLILILLTHLIKHAFPSKNYFK